MIFSSTILAYLILFFALGFLSYRFFLYWREAKDITSKIFFFFTVSFSMFALIRVVSAILFFFNYSQALYYSLILITFIESFVAAMMAYLITNLKFHRISPWLAFSVIFFIGLLTTFYSINVSCQPLVESFGAIDWGFTTPGFSLNYWIMRLVILFFIFIPLTIMLIEQLKTTVNPIVKKRALNLIFVSLIAVTIGIIDFVLSKLLKLDLIYRDVIIGSLGILLFITVFISRKTTNLPYVKKN